MDNIIYLLIFDKEKGSKMKQKKIDTIDEQILNELTQHAKMPLRKIAKKLKMSFVTVMHRIKKLEKEGIIIKYTAKINYDLLGYDIHVLVEVRISKGKLLELENKLAKFPNIYEVFDTTGEFDAAIMGKFKSTKMLDEFVKKIQTLDFVERTNTKLILNTVKDDQIQL